jgi:toxin ParE1/3/4
VPVSLRFTSRARNDLRDIAAYTLEKWGTAQCDRYLDALQEHCRQVAETPKLRRLSPDFPSYCRALVGRHAIFYRVDDHDSVLVVRILHASMLPELHLPDATDDIGEDE